MQVDDAYGRTWSVTDEKDLEEILVRRDERGGGHFWLRSEGKELAIRLSGDLADVHFFLQEGIYFRCNGGKGLPEGGMTKMIFHGCDPWTGEETPNEFLLPWTDALTIAKAFWRHGCMAREYSWLAL